MSEENILESEKEKVSEEVKDATISQKLENDREKNSFFKCNKPLVIALGIVTLLLVVYIVGAVIFKGRTMFGTFVNGVDCSNKTVEEIKTILSEKLDNYQMEIVTVDGKTETVKGEDIGLRYENIDELDGLCENQNAFTWPASIFTQTDLSIDLKTTYDKEATKKIIESFDFMNKSKMIAPENAEIIGYCDGVKIKNSVFGTTIDENTVYTKFDEMVLALKEQWDLKETDCYVGPQMLEESEDFSKLKEAAETVGKTRINYSDSGKTVGIDGNTAVTWLMLNDKKQVVLNNEKLGAFVAGLSATYNESHPVARTFKTSYGTPINVGTTTYGKTLNESAEYSRLNADILAGKVETIAPSLTNFGNPESGEYNPGGTYVEINIGKQRLFCYKDGVKVVDTAVITGKTSASWDTPVGIYSIYAKQTDRMLTGPDYSVHVDYWMPFYQDYGLHDSSWHNIFGYDLFTLWGSHGCINIPTAAAGVIYNSVSVGTPVILYHLGTPDPALPGTSVSQYAEQPKPEDNKQE